MKNVILPSIIISSLICLFPSLLLAGETVCSKSDPVCREFSALSAAGKYRQIIEKARPKQSYSTATRQLIGQAYLMEAGREGVSQQEEEQLCLKALEYGATSAYLGLYFMYASTDKAKANGYLRQMVATKPETAVPYVLLGEADYEQGSYATAKEYLYEGRTLSRNQTGDLDWMVFKASYLSGDYSLASTMLDSSFSKGKTVGDLKALVAADQRFGDMGTRWEFRKFFKILNGSTLTKLSARI